MKGIPMAHTTDITKQKRRMQVRWKNWRIAQETSKIVRWEGEVTPDLKTYRLQIDLSRRPMKGFLGLPEPKVRVLTPKIREHDIPRLRWNLHVYRDKTLCLVKREETRQIKNATVADYTVPWAMEWLVCYEYWQITGEWVCGGEHPRRR